MVLKTPVHPGEVLREDVLADLGLSVGEAAARLGISRVTLSRVLHGHARVSPQPGRASGGGRCRHRPCLAGHAVGPRPRCRTGRRTADCAQARSRRL